MHITPPGALARIVMMTLYEWRTMAHNKRAWLSAALFALLATVGADGGPRMAPVCPIFAGEHLYLIVGEATPKNRQLRRDPRYVLHAFLGDDDEEFQIRGRASPVDAEAERSQVHAAADFSFQIGDPIFRLSVEHCLWCHWENVGQPDTKALRRRWSDGRG